MGAIPTSNRIVRWRVRAGARFAGREAELHAGAHESCSSDRVPRPWWVSCRRSRSLSANVLGAAAARDANLLCLCDFREAFLNRSGRLEIVGRLRYREEQGRESRRKYLE